MNSLYEDQILKENIDRKKHDLVNISDDEVPEPMYFNNKCMGKVNSIENNNDCNDACDGAKKFDDLKNKNKKQKGAETFKNNNNDFRSYNALENGKILARKTETDVMSQHKETAKVLQVKEAQLQKALSQLKFDNEAPIFEYHSFNRPVLLDRQMVAQNVINSQFETENKETLEELAAAIDELHNQIHCAGDNDEDSVSQNLVLRVFLHFYALHKYLNEELPSSQMNYVPSDYQYNVPLKRTMPNTLSIKVQIISAVKKLKSFSKRLQRVLDENINFDYAKGKECQDSLNLLETLTEQLRDYTGIDFKHIDYKFVAQNANEQAKNLELLLKLINDQIREAHIFNEVFDWLNNIEHRLSQARVKERQETLKYGLNKAAADIKAAIDDEEQATKDKNELMAIAKEYNLEDVAQGVLSCDKMLSEMLADPEAFFNRKIPDEIPSVFTTKGSPEIEAQKQEFFKAVDAYTDAFPDVVVKRMAPPKPKENAMPTDGAYGNLASSLMEAAYTRSSTNGLRKPSTASQTGTKTATNYRMYGSSNAATNTAAASQPASVRAFPSFASKGPLASTPACSSVPFNALNFMPSVVPVVSAASNATATAPIIPDQSYCMEGVENLRSDINNLLLEINLDPNAPPRAQRRSKQRNINFG